MPIGFVPRLAEKAIYGSPHQGSDGDPALGGELPQLSRLFWVQLYLRPDHAIMATPSCPHDGSRRSAHPAVRPSFLLGCETHDDVDGRGSGERPIVVIRPIHHHVLFRSRGSLKDLPALVGRNDGVA